MKDGLGEGATRGEAIAKDTIDGDRTGRSSDDARGDIKETAGLIRRSVSPTPPGDAKDILLVETRSGESRPANAGKPGSGVLAMELSASVSGGVTRRVVNETMDGERILGDCPASGDVGAEDDAMEDLECLRRPKLPSNVNLRGTAES